MRATILLGLALAGALASAAAAEEPRRENGPHTHGEGRVGIAIDGNRLELELEAPAADIVGFEHAAATDADRKAVADAAALLEKVERIVAFPAEAGCKLEASSVEAEGALSGTDPDAAKPADPNAPKAPSDEPAGHSEMHAVYAFACAAPDKLTSLSFPYFATFERAQKLTVSISGPKGQTQGTVTRQTPTFTLTGTN